MGIELHPHSVAARAIKEFNQKHSATLEAHRRGEAVHPEHVAAYEADRGALTIPHGFDTRLVPPQINIHSRTKGTQVAQAGQGQPERVLDYSQMKPKIKEPEHSMTWNRDGSITTENLKTGKKETSAPKLTVVKKSVMLIDHVKKTLAKSTESTEQGHQMDPKRAMLDKAKSMLECFNLHKAWQVPGQVPPKHKETK